MNHSSARTKAYLLLIAPAIMAASWAERDAKADAPFVDITAESGLDFVHFNGMSGELYYAEMMGSGAALFDYDNDGDLDIYLVQGAMLGPNKKISEATFAPEHDPPLTDRLYRNDSGDGESDRVRFTDVTKEAGILASAYGMGVAAGDFDNDGHVDLYISNFGPNQLLHNNGDGTFSDVTEAAGVGDSAWSVSSSFVDYDSDGLLDIYVGNYVDYTIAGNKPCRSTTSARDYCSPKVYRPQNDTLYRNLGDGGFADVSRMAGIHEVTGGALGVVAADFNGDLAIDIYVANDGVPNQLWINDGDGRFRDEAYLSGVAVNMDGAPEASMGVAAADFDGDGDMDLLMTHLARETSTLYVNDGSGWFEDRTATAGLAGPSFAYTGFGTVWLDYDNDGWLDLFVANGAVTRNQELVDRGDPYPLGQANQLFVNLGNAQFKLVDVADDPIFRVTEVSRGVASGDIDNDGDVDLLLTNNAGRARLLLNQSGNQARWIGFRLTDAGGLVDRLGALVSLSDNHGMTQHARTGTDGSYASASDPRLIFGLGQKERGKYSVVVVWPDRQRENWSGLDAGRYHTLRKGSGDSSE
ncbi:MAG: CRTAC1 family protein [Gammaproteobacteria bacterium]|nr:CRTAC1 family protein [Gammaproteobacteria bacterium]